MEMLNNFIGLTLQLSVPIVLGALCGTIAERGGIILLGVEGIMLPWWTSYPVSGASPMPLHCCSYQGHL